LPAVAALPAAEALSEGDRCVQEAASKTELPLCVKFGNFAERWRTQSQAGLRSPRFFAGGAAFQLEIAKSVGDSASLRLHRVDSAIDPVLIWMSASLRRTDGTTQTMTFKKARWFAPAWADHPKTVGWANFCGERMLVGQAQERRNDSMMIHLVITIETPRDATPRDHHSCLRNNLGTGVLSLVRGAADLVTLSAANGFQVQVPKDLLCTYSEVFRANLKSEMAEASSKVIEMTDLHGETVETFLSCLYYGGFPPPLATLPWRRTAELLVMADRYAVQPLADTCVWVLCVALSNRNAADMLRLADERGLSKLRFAVVSFATSHVRRAEAMMNKDAFASFGPDLLRELTAHWMQLKQREASEDEVDVIPPFMQWTEYRRDQEFDDATEWQKLPANSLRRACFERGLASVGTAAELVARLSGTSAQTPAALTAPSASSSSKLAGPQGGGEDLELGNGEPRTKRQRLE